MKHMKLLFTIMLAAGITASLRASQYLHRAKKYASENPKTVAGATLATGAIVAGVKKTGILTRAWNWLMGNRTAYEVGQNAQQYLTEGAHKAIHSFKNSSTKTKLGVGGLGLVGVTALVGGGMYWVRRRGKKIIEK